jgi:hypothetical protein
MSRIAQREVVDIDIAIGHRINIAAIKNDDSYSFPISSEPFCIRFSASLATECRKRQNTVSNPRRLRGGFDDIDVAGLRRRNIGASR